MCVLVMLTCDSEHLLYGLIACLSNSFCFNLAIVCNPVPIECAMMIHQRIGSAVHRLECCRGGASLFTAGALVACAVNRRGCVA